MKRKEKIKYLLALSALLSTGCKSNTIYSNYGLENPETNDTYVDGYLVTSEKELDEKIKDTEINDSCPFDKRVLVTQSIDNDEIMKKEGDSITLGAKEVKKTLTLCRKN